jgi:hypothetical protein
MSKHIFRLISNRYAGKCDCGAQVAPHAGFYSTVRRAIVCSSVLNQHGYCPAFTAAHTVMPTTIPAYVARGKKTDDELAVEHRAGDRVRNEFSASGVVIGVARRKELHWRDSKALREIGECKSWVGQQIVLIRWDNGSEGGTSPDDVNTMLKWQPAHIFQKVQS